MTDNNTKSRSEEKIQNCFDYFLDKYQTDEEFTRDELFRATGWSKSSFNIYYTKIFRHFIKDVDDKCIITEAFRKFSTWKDFRKNFSQSRDTKQKYKSESYSNVIIFEFFMPLTHEGALKSALDSLFYKDTITRRLKLVPIEEIEKKFMRLPNEENNDYNERIYEWISKKFIGYSINHYKGRFRVGNLKTFDEVAKIQKQAGRYIEDETTAIVKFIFPCGAQEEAKKFSSFSEDQIQKEADLIRFFFEILFINIILEVISGEDEIWMLESGMKTNLHIWKPDTQ